MSNHVEGGPGAPCCCMVGCFWCSDSSISLVSEVDSSCGAVCTSSVILILYTETRTATFFFASSAITCESCCPTRVDVPQACIRPCRTVWSRTTPVPSSSCKEISTLRTRYGDGVIPAVTRISPITPSTHPHCLITASRLLLLLLLTLMPVRRRRRRRPYPSSNPALPGTSLAPRRSAA